MSSQQLAELTIDFVTKGSGDADKQIDAKGRNLKDGEKQAGLFAKALGGMNARFKGVQDAISGMAANISKAFERIKASAQIMSISGTLGIGGLIAGASRGTVEGDRLSLAFERVTRVVGDKFAPYVRMASEALNDFADWFMKLDPAMVEASVETVVMTTAIAGLVVGIGVGVSILGTFAKSLISIVALGPTVIKTIGGIAASMVGIGRGAGAATAVTAAAGAGGASKGGAAVAAGVGAGTVAKSVGKKLLGATVVGLAAYEIGDYIYGKFQSHHAAERYEKENPYGDYKHAPPVTSKPTAEGGSRSLTDRVASFFDDAEKRVRSLTGLSTKPGDGVASKITDYLKDLRKRAGDGGFQAQGKSFYEDARQTFDRLNLAFANRDQAFTRDNVGKAQLDETKKMSEKVGAAAAGITRIADAFPAVR